MNDISRRRFVLRTIGAAAGLSLTPLSEPMVAIAQIPRAGFSGVVRIRTWFGKHVAPYKPWPFGTFRPDYSSSAHNWQLLPSRHGGYWIRTLDGGSYYYWQTDMRDGDRKIVLHPGADDWETFFIDSHGSGGYVLRSFSNGMKYVCAEPEDHGIHLTASRQAAAQWEQFHIDVVQTGLPGDPASPQRRIMSFTCTNCGRVIGQCGGGVPGEKHVYCSSPLGE